MRMKKSTRKQAGSTFMVTSLDSLRIPSEWIDAPLVVQSNCVVAIFCFPDRDTYQHLIYKLLSNVASFYPLENAMCLHLLLRSFFIIKLEMLSPC